MCVAKVDAEVGLIDRNGSWLIKPSFKHVRVPRGNGGLFFAEVRDRWGIVVSSGRWVVTPQFKEIESYPEDFDTGPGLVSAKADSDLWGFINKHGRWVINPKFKEVRRVSAQGIFAAQAVSEGLWGIANSKGDWVVNPTFHEIGYESLDQDALISARLGQKVGFINPKGAWLFAPVFDDLPIAGTSFSEFSDYPFVSLNGLVGVLDRSGNWRVKPSMPNTSWWEFAEAGVGLYKPFEVSPFKSDNLWGFIDSSGKWVIAPSFFRVGRFG